MTPESIGSWLERNLASVTKPARYLGNEVGAVSKGFASANVTMAFCFPDVYEVGMSHLGIKILYDIVNRRPGMLCERVFAPWVDMEALMRADGVPLFSLESRHALSEFDVVGFTLQYELSFTNIVSMLDLAGIPLLAADRSVTDPIVVGGGPVAYNPEPVAAFFDCFLIGDGEESLVEFLQIVSDWRAAPVNDDGAGASGGPAASRDELYRRLARLPGCYVPSLYACTYSDGGQFMGVTPVSAEAPAVVTKRIVRSLDSAEAPRTIPVPFMDIVHDRVMLEVMRGCGRGCRFCQAGMVYRPVRERTAEGVCDLAGALLESTGYEELSLASLSTADHSRIRDILSGLIAEHGPRNVSVSLPSLRADAFSLELAQLAQSARKTGLTFAPEAGTQRLRDVINKGVTEDGLLDAIGAAFGAGWDQVKLYFMIGLPTETDEDVLGIAELAKMAVGRARQAKREAGRGGGVEIGISVASFVPKAHTPFQWFPQTPREELERRQSLLARELKGRTTTFSWHDSKTSLLEAVFARGDRRLADAVLVAWRKGARFDGWAEHFNFALWMEALTACGLDVASYANRERALDEPLPWDHISAGIDPDFLRAEWGRALAASLTPDCRDGVCGGCGVCSALNADVALAGGAR